MGLCHLQKGSLTSSFPTWTHFISWFCLIALARNSKSILNRSGESKHPCLMPDVSSNGFGCSQLSIMLSIVCCIYPLLWCETFLLFLVLSELLSWKGVKFWQTFLYLLGESSGFIPILLFICSITFIDFCMSNYPCIPGMKPTCSWSMIFLIMLLNSAYQYFVENICLYIY
jgi:hypothetical protein